MPGGFPYGLSLCNAQSSQNAGNNASPSRGTSITAAHNAYGAWTALLTPTCDVCWMVVRLWGATSSSVRSSLNIGVGASGAQAVVVEDLFTSTNTNAENYTEYSFPISIPAGTPIWGQTNGSAAADAQWVSITVYDAAFNGIEGAAGIDSIGFNSATTSGTDVDPGATAYTKGAFTQIVSATAKDYQGIMFVGGDNASDTTASLGSDAALFDLAVGSLGNEQVVVPNMPFTNAGIGRWASFCAIMSAIDIPAGTRLSLRCQSPISTVGTRIIGTMLYGAYK